MQGDSSSMQATVPSQATTNTTSIQGGGEGGGGSGGGAIGSILASGVDESDQNLMRNYSGNRWPRQETLALLKIRSDMESIFRDSTHKGPLWEEVSRKLAELGYHRTPKKCREKFENVYKYHKRTKEGRTGKSESKTYRYFDQLEAFDSIQVPSHSTSLSLPLPPQPPQQNPQTQITTTTTSTTTATMPVTTGNLPNPIIVTTSQNIVTSNNNAMAQIPIQTSQPTNPPSSMLDISSNSTSSSTASDEELEGGSRKRKRKWKVFFKRLTKDVLKKQEELQKRFLEAVERKERERITREEAWRTQEMARINREHEILIQERSASAAKDAAIITFLQKMSGQDITSFQTQYNPTTQPPPPPSAHKQPTQVQPISTSPRPTNTMSWEYTIPRRDNGDNANLGTISSRWPKAEVHALIKIRTNLDVKYQHSGPKGPLWEEISAEMLKLGYNRSAKRCKEKWENINKYFKKVKESSRKRRENSKTCPYYQQLDALYKEKSLSIEGSANVGSIVTPIEQMETLVVTPEQQWPPVEATGFQRKNTENIKGGVGEDEEEEEETEEDDDEGEFEVVPNKAVVVPHGNGE